MCVRDANISWPPAKYCVKQKPLSQNGEPFQTENLYTATSRKVVGKKVHAAIPKGNMGYDQYTVPGTVAVEPTFVAFL